MNDNENVFVENLEKLIKEDNIIKYDPICVRKKSNISKSSNEYKFDSPDFSPKKLLNDIPNVSPKLDYLVKNIENLDKDDLKKHGKRFKHFVFSDLKSSSAGSKLLASALVASGMKMAYHKPGSKLELLSDVELLKSKNNNLYLLSSTGVYEKPISVTNKKEMLKKFNQRPENIHGELARIIVMDSGFKEGIDLFDIKYIHLFEPSILESDQKQVIGRGTRTCGQKGLEFIPNRGWPLHIYVYDLEIPEKVQSSFLDSKNAIELYLKATNLDVRLFHFSHDLEETSILGSVDYDLNKNIHSFSISGDDSVNAQHGGSKRLIELNKKDSTVIVPTNKFSITLPNGILVGNPPEEQLGYKEMKKYIQDEFSHYEWGKVKMENLCKDDKKGGAGQVITYTPTQDFIRHYFTPENPLKGMLLWNSVGTGKTCSAIATATSSFEQEGYTILWVTRTTLKSDIWKNMFDQVCNEDIRDKLINNTITVSDDNKKNMKLLSKSWRIRPMSYKQFSNLVSKQNAFYKTLVKINGEIDPLKKTLLIIDEAHKLYGGTDLSSLERPDMNAFHQALMNSYQISGKDSVKLLLMTATPITQSPMELVKLLNLCKTPEQQLATEFDEFREQFLDEDGKFTENGKNDYLDKIAGHISYLNREKDARQFAQPIIHKISVPLLNDISAIDKFDKKYIRNFLESDVLKLKKEIEENTEKLENDIDELDPNRLNYLKDKCKNVETDKEKKACEKIVRENIRLLTNETKVEVDRIKQEIKDVREQIKNKNLFKNEQMSNIKENMGKYKKDYDIFTQSTYYNIRNQCGKTSKTPSELRTQILEHPKVIQYDEKIVNLNERINELQGNLKRGDENYKKRMKQLRELGKDNLNQLEKDVIKLVIRDERKSKRNLTKTKNKETSKLIEKIKNKIKKTQKRREKTYKTIRKTLKEVIYIEKRQEKKIKTTEREEKRILREQEDYREEINNELMKNLGEKYSNKIDDELVVFNEKGKLIQEEKLKKDNEKKEKKQQVRQEKKEQMIIKKEKERATKKLLKEKARQDKKNNKTMKKND